METLLGLVAQSSTSYMYHSPHYLGRAIVELCKLAPQSTFPAALVHGVGCIAGSECSSLVPNVRKRLAHWFGYHLFNTEFQWPYWSHWDPYSTTEGTSAYSNAKTQFVAHALEYCADLSSFSCIQEKCLPRESPHLSLIRPFDVLIFQHDPRIDHPLTTELLEKVRAKESVAVLLEWFSDEDTVARANDEVCFYFLFSWNILFTESSLTSCNELVFCFPFLLSFSFCYLILHLSTAVGRVANENGNTCYHW